MALLDNLRRTLDRYDLLRPGESVLAAVSGGPDSLSLLHALHMLQSELQISSLSAAHLDHGLRGAESAAEAAFVADFCAARDIPCFIETLDAGVLAQTQGSGLQAAARAVRYDFLQRAATQASANKIATAHTQDDQIETILMRILRGSGLEGLRGVPYSRGNIIRPLLDATRTEVEAYCAEYQLDPRRDPSNADTSHYLRNRVRLDLLPDLEANYAPGVRAALLRLSQNATLDDDYLQSQAKAALNAIQASKSPQSITLSRGSLADLAPALQRRVLRMALGRLREASQDITEIHIANFLAAVKKPAVNSYSIHIPHPPCRMLLEEETIVISIPAEAPSEAEAVSLPVPGSCLFGEKEWTVQAQLTAEKSDSDYFEILDADRIDLSNLYVRSWLPGDRIDMFGLGGKTKKLSDLFTDAKVPREQRRAIPVVTDSKGPLWVVGMRIAERARTTDETVRFLRLSAVLPSN